MEAMPKAKSTILLSVYRQTILLMKEGMIRLLMGYPINWQGMLLAYHASVP
jgi:hypothetical protein